jgi:hypothetical protein
MPKLKITIVDSGTRYFDRKSNEMKGSLLGHMWFEITDDEGNTYSFGFAPKEEWEGWPLAPGQVYDNDNSKYNFDGSPGDFMVTIDISQSQFNDLLGFGLNPKEYGFKPTYNGLTNCCIV